MQTFYECCGIRAFSEKSSKSANEIVQHQREQPETLLLMKKTCVDSVSVDRKVMTADKEAEQMSPAWETRYRKIKWNNKV